MSKKYSFFAFVVILSVFNFARSDARNVPSRLLLHFDINRTLIATDKVSRKSQEDILNEAIADKVYDRWDDSIDDPISYSDYVKHHICPDKERNPAVKNKQKELLSKTLTVLEERNHPLYRDVLQVYERSLEVLKSQKNTIFSSFFKLLDYLDQKKISYTLILRSFGPDAPEIGEELKRELRKEMIHEFLSMKQGILWTNEGQKDLYEYIKQASYHFSVRDDWEHWYKHDEIGQFGKRFPVDLEDTETISLFFDDNARLDEKRPDRNAIAPYDVKTGNPLSVERLIEQCRIFPVDTLEALCEEDYYIQLIEKALSS
jgi:hypothetical protein